MEVNLVIIIPKHLQPLGPLGTPLTTFPKYLTPTDGRPYGFSNEGGTVWSVVSSVGTRYKLAPLSDLMVDLDFNIISPTGLMV